jgi:guanylate kinase
MEAAEEFDAIIVNDDVRRAASELVSLIEAVCPPSGP